ncbi:hypothetical protein BC829DRAFT_233274 [Chytridium lagenaria]|nr:hypothetical protein BC829DRAFT_233274 [Chytridium lagenaria]
MVASVSAPPSGTLTPATPAPSSPSTTQSKLALTAPPSTTKPSGQPSTSPNVSAKSPPSVSNPSSLAVQPASPGFLKPLPPFAPAHPLKAPTLVSSPFNTKPSRLNSRLLKPSFR